MTEGKARKGEGRGGEERQTKIYLHETKAIWRITRGNTTDKTDLGKS